MLSRAEKIVELHQDSYSISKNLELIHSDKLLMPKCKEESDFYICGFFEKL